MFLRRSLPIKFKLTLSFLTVAILIGVVGIIGALSLKNVNNKASECTIEILIMSMRSYL